MLTSFVISLRLESETALPGHGGEALHGLFFETLRAHNPTLTFPRAAVVMQSAQVSRL
jgi:hypothetical protein